MKIQNKIKDSLNQGVSFVLFGNICAFEFLSILKD